MMDRLEGLHRAEAAIVGGGLTGLLLAASLTEEGMRVAVIEALDGACIPGTGAASLLCAPSFMRVEAAHGLMTAQQYAQGLQAQLHAFMLAPLAYVQQMPVYAYACSADELPALEQQHELLTRLHIPIGIAPDAGGCPFPVELSLMTQGALVNIHQWTAALRVSILRGGGRIFTDSRVIAIDGTRICTVNGCVDSEHIILATGKPLGVRSRRMLALLETCLTACCELTSRIPLHSCQQSVTDVGLTLHPTASGAIAAWDASRLGMRDQQQRLHSFQEMLHRRMPDWQQGEIQYAQAVSSADGLPVIGALPGSQVLCASGITGILGAMHAAEVLTRRILGRTLTEDAIYTPDRNLPKAVIRPKMRNISRIYARNMLRRSAPHCAHCACRMRYSTAAKRWECPYCGTCYTMLGQVICGPGMRSAQLSVRQRPDI